MKIEIPPQVGIIPSAEREYDDENHEFNYIAVINVVGAYTEPGYGYGEDRQHTDEREVWRSERKYSTEDQALVEAVNKLAGIIRKLV